MLLILDRDGVINQDSPGNYVCNADQWQPIPGSLEAMGRLQRAGFTLVVASNQSGLARRLFTHSDLNAVTEKMMALAAAAGAEIRGFFYCPHHPDDRCGCRKPARGLLQQIEKALNQSVEGATIIGDKRSDLELAATGHCRPLLVRTGHGAITERELGNQKRQIGEKLLIFDDLSEAADYLIRSLG